MSEIGQFRLTYRLPRDMKIIISLNLEVKKTNEITIGTESLVVFRSKFGPKTLYRTI